jgi:hypothetical protein
MPYLSNQDSSENEEMLLKTVPVKKGITRIIDWKTRAHGLPHYEERAIKTEMLTKSVRTEGLGVSL